MPRMAGHDGTGTNGLLASNNFFYGANGVFGLGAQYGVMLPFSRKHESEADYMGLVLMTMAGYNPDAAIPFWKKMAASGGSKPPEILSSHPSDATRIAAISAAIPGIRAKYAPPAPPEK